MNTFLYTLLYVSTISAMIPVGVFLAKRSGGYAVTIFILAVISFLSDAINRIMVLNGYRGFYIFNTYFILQFLLLSYVFTLLLLNKKIVYAGALLFALFTFYISLNIQGFAEYQSWTRTTGGVILLTYSVLYYRQLLITLPAQNIGQYAPFWINTAVSLYFSFNLFLFIIANYVFTNLPADAGMLVWGFHNVNNILKNILFAVGIYYAGKKQVGL
ncbi:MAG TPA: hypothetical protein VFN30_01870 [Chitinophagaceae bacterium]|nr:hypothetical protein [Chitinophagaceae bacterium]